MGATLSACCNEEQGFEEVIGWLIVAGPFSNQSAQCDLGARCLVAGLQGARLSATDRLIPMKRCGTTMEASAFPQPEPTTGTFNESSELLVFDLGDLGMEGLAPEEVRLCWCSLDSACQVAEDFRAEAMLLHVVCPPGWYELLGPTVTCQSCPPGYYCPGRPSAPLLACPAGSTSFGGANAAEVCTCRRGHFLDARLEACSPCPPGYYADETGSLLCQSCPSGTSSSPGALALRECFCIVGVDMDPSRGLNCTDLAAVPAYQDPASLAEVSVEGFAFNGSIFTPTGSLEGLRANLSEHLGLGLRSSMRLEVHGPETAYYEIVSLEEEEASRFHAKFDPLAFSAWMLSLHGTQLASILGVSPVAEILLQCPAGMGFLAGDFVSTPSDCKCLPGYYSNGQNCTLCPQATYKSLGGNSTCQSCGTFTTMQDGAVSVLACTCHAGYVNLLPSDPMDCQVCGHGFFCQGGTHQQACGESQTTASETAKSADECVCAAGFIRAGAVCESCPPGRFKELAESNFCEACPVGKWSAAYNATSSSTCASCVDGSTTTEVGAADESFCVKPIAEQILQCTSGKTCEISISGSRLQDGHRLAVSLSDCSSAKLPVLNVANEGISSSATENGSRYVWNHTANDLFAPEGGSYNLCWCANMGDLSCDGLDSHFVVSAGQLKVLGPFANHTFTCVRGQDCLHLSPVIGLAISTADSVAVRSICTSATPLQLSANNSLGVGGLGLGELIEQTGYTALTLGFGTSASGASYHVSMNPDDRGYALCWCQGGQGVCSAEAHVVSAGRLRIAGPEPGQAAECFQGQAYVVELAGVDLAVGDRLTVLEECGQGLFLSGLPGGFARGSGHSYSFSGPTSNSSYLQAELPGLYLMCWCRPSLQHDLQCSTPADFRVDVGLFRATGPFAGQSAQCDLGARCLVAGLQGARLSATDRLIPMKRCGTTMEASAFPQPEPTTGTFNESSELLVFDLGDLGMEGLAPEEVRLCWCSLDSACQVAEDFRAEAMLLHLVCPPGWYELLGPTVTCQSCLPGYYCPGGPSAPLLACPRGSTAPGSSVALDACLCRRGYFWDAEINACLACAPGTFKAEPGNVDCDVCPNDTISLAAALSLQGCYCPAGSLDADPEPDSFLCRDLSFFRDIFADQRKSTSANVFSFQGFIVTAAGADTGQWQGFSEHLLEHLGLSDLADRALLETRSCPGLEDRCLSFAISSSERELADEMRDQFGSLRFASWVYSSFTGTEVASVEALNVSDVALDTLQCQPGLDFLGQPNSLADCKCAVGMQPSLGQGCIKCPKGTYKPSVEDSECLACPAGSRNFTTMQEGAVSVLACTCHAGYVNLLPSDPMDCQVCGHGFFCQGGTDQQACGEAQTTASETAKSADECVCAAGFIRAGAVCESCPPGRFKELAESNFCEACPVGKWSAAYNATSSSTCVSCVDGSTTTEVGAADESFCVKPIAEQVLQCTSGKTCEISISGSRLQDGHRLAVSLSDCSSAKLPVLNVANEGISSSATESGSRYVWNHTANDLFAPEGGSYNLCWCANMGDLSCDGLDSHFVVSAGQLKVLGPFANHTFTCVRGQDCFGKHFSGHGLSSADRIVIKKTTCGASAILQLTRKNSVGMLNMMDQNFITLSFSQASSDQVSLDANADYAVCWCSGYADSCTQTEDFIVPAGRLAVSGPYVNQRSSCFVGQRCLMENISGELEFCIILHLKVMPGGLR